jgi:transcriptional regulator with XRE-family HTH domain
MNHPVDIHVGSVLRRKRKEADITQEELAEAVGITFQQVQKYEKGKNRISCSKLYEFAKFLGVDVSSFFDGLDVEYAFNDPASMALADGSTLSKKQQIERVTSLFAQLNDTKVRMSVINLLESLINSSRRAKSPKKTADSAN